MSNWSSISPAIDVETGVDRSTTIRTSLRDVERTLILAVLLVVIVVFAFLRNLRATFIPVVAVSVSLVATFAAMYLMGYSLDNLSLMALTVATGFAVGVQAITLNPLMPLLGAPVCQYAIEEKCEKDGCSYPTPWTMAM